MKIALEGRVALVGGATQGIGRATALAFAAEGCHVALCARNREALEALAAELHGQFGVEVYTESVDMRETAAIEAFTKNAVARLGRVDICVANTGGPPPMGFLQAADEDWSSAFNLSLRSAFTLARAVIPDMQRRRWGRFVTVSSISVRMPLPDLVLSNAIRTGVMGLVRSLANEFGQDGITANNVAPGYTATDRLLALSRRISELSGQTEQQIQETWIRDIPVGRLARPEEVADAVVFLASERAAFITGQTLLVDGGMYKGL